MNRDPIVVVGGGVTGLMAARMLSAEAAFSREGFPNVLLLESSKNVGGKISTIRSEGCLLEEGPDSIAIGSSISRDLVPLLSLEEEVIEPERSGYSVLHKGRLYEVEGGLFSQSKVDQARAVLSTGAVSWAGKIRAAAGAFVPPREGKEDLSIARFGRSRFGAEFSKVLVEPLLAGIHAGRSERLSMSALYPQLCMRKSGKPSRPRAAFAKRRSPFYSFRSGMQELVQRLKAPLLSDQIRTDCGVLELEAKDDGILLHLKGGAHLKASKCIVAAPAYESAELLSHSYPELSRLLRRIRFSSSAVVNVVLRANEFPSESVGNGFLATEESGSALSGCTFSSLKWAGRAPDGVLLLRCFVGGARGSQVVEQLSEGELGELAVADLSRLFRCKLKPLLSQVKIWKRAFPQYEIGHQRRLQEVLSLEQETPNLYLAGASYRGSSIPSCLQDGKRVAQLVLNDCRQ